MSLVENYQPHPSELCFPTTQVNINSTENIGHTLVKEMEYNLPNSEGSVSHANDISSSEEISSQVRNCGTENNDHIVKDTLNGSAKKKKSRKSSGSLKKKKAAKRIEDLDRSLSISLEELLQNVNASQYGLDEIDIAGKSQDFEFPQLTPNSSSHCLDSSQQPHSEIASKKRQNDLDENEGTDKSQCFESSQMTPNSVSNNLDFSSPQPDDEIVVTDSIDKQHQNHGLIVEDTFAMSGTTHKHRMPQGKDTEVGLAPNGLLQTCNYLRNINLADSKNIAAPPSINFSKIDLRCHGDDLETDGDLSPTSLEVTSILQNVANDDDLLPHCQGNEAMTDDFDNHDSNKYANAKAIASNNENCRTPEYCQELSTLTLEPCDAEYTGTQKNRNYSKEDGKLKLSRPRRAKEVQHEVLYSGIVTFPGCYDNSHRPVLFIHCDLIDASKTGQIEMARMMLYLVSSSSYITLVVNLLNKENLEITMESVLLFQTNRPGVMSRIIFLITDTDFHPELDALQAEHQVIHNKEELCNFIGLDDLPESLSGKMKYNHIDWVRQRLDVESYVLLCERLQHNFATNTVAMTTATLPATLQDTSEMLNRHRSTMTALLDDQRVRDLHDTGHRFLTQLSSIEKAENQSYSDQIQSSYESVCSAIQRYVQAADERLLALEKHLLVKQFEESCDRILSWASDRRDELEQKFGEVADSLNELRIQRQEFDHFYLEVVKQYAQCDCLLSEANQLSSSGFLGQVNSQARNAAEKISQVVQDMEMKKEEVETASQLYLFVDQAYSWALAGMKFVASLSMNDTLNTDELQEQIEKYDDYMSNHPSIPNEEFVRMQQIASQYNNLKCQKQCEVAQLKCNETWELFVKRRKLLVKARDHQLQELCRKEGKETPELKEDMVEQLAENHLNNNVISDANETTCDTTPSEKPTRVVLRQNSDISHRLNRPHGNNNNNNGGLPILNGPNESAAAPTSSKHRQKKMLRKSASMSSQHARIKIGSPMLTEERDTQGRTKWSLAIEELITTEREYVKSLNYIIEHYYPLMNQLDDVPQALRGKRGVVFGNIENICDFHSGQFLEALRECRDQPGRVAEVFIQYRESFGMYALYSKNKPRSDELMREHGTKFFKAKQHSLRDKMDLASYLLKPVQRMGKYALLLHNIAKHSEIQYRSSLREAESLVKFQLRHGNNLLAMDSIVGCDVNLKEQGELRRQDEFLIFRGRRKFLRHVFLFDELILLSKPQKIHGGHDVYHYKGSHKTAEIGLTENIGETGLKFEIWFRRMMTDNIIFNSSNEQKKQAWVDEIRGILWKQALRNKANRRNEMVNMGVGSKPHLDIRSSEDPITDRSVATERFMGGRVLSSRCRASIAVATFDHACKRPHSTVSTSSTSSNGSCQYTPHQPASMFDFRAIVEGDEYESGSGHGSSLCMSNGEVDPLEGAQESGDASPQQYVTTV